VGVGGNFGGRRKIRKRKKKRINEEGKMEKK